MEKLISKIAEGSDLSEKEVEKKIKEKERELSGLVSPEGAAYIVAKELGLDLLEKRENRLKLTNIIPGMRNVSLVGKVMSVSDVREFEKDGRKGKVANVVIGDETGSVRMSLWDKETQHIGKTFSEENVVEVKGAYVKEDNLGNPEVRVGKFGKFSLSKEKIDKVKKTPRGGKAKRMSLSEGKEGDFIENRAAITNIFEGKYFFEVCPKCDSSLKDGKCKEHGKVKGKKAMFLTGTIDDGTGNMRFVVYRDTAAKLLGLKDENVSEKEISKASKKIIGKEYLFVGRVKKNAYFENLEMSVSRVEEVDLKKEINNLAKEVRNG